LVELAMALQISTQETGCSRILAYQMPQKIHGPNVEVKLNT